MVTPAAPFPVPLNNEILALAVFAVKEHNTQAGTSLEFRMVLSAERQLVEGYNYYITLKAGDEGKTNIYDATVYVNHHDNHHLIKKLTDFKMLTLKPGEPVPIEVTDVMNDLGHWAVNQYNQEQRKLLMFKSVWSAEEQQVQEGFNFYLTLEAEDRRKKNVYDAQVFVNLMNVKKLKEFNLLGPVQ